MEPLPAVPYPPRAMNEPDGRIARKGAILVKWGFEQYRSGFRRITRRSALHFETSDWHGVQHDMVERLALYTNVVRRVVASLEEVFGQPQRSPELWSAMKREFSWLMNGHGDLELAETFFNSVTRKVFTTVGVDPKREFVHFGSDSGLPATGAVPVRTYPGALSTRSVVHQVLDDYEFGIPWADYEGDAELVGRLREHLLELLDRRGVGEGPEDAPLLRAQASPLEPLGRVRLEPEAHPAIGEGGFDCVPREAPVRHAPLLPDQGARSAGSPLCRGAGKREKSIPCAHGVHALGSEGRAFVETIGLVEG